MVVLMFFFSKENVTNERSFLVHASICKGENVATCVMVVRDCLCRSVLQILVFPFFSFYDVLYIT